jgi:hypothetical protein
LLMLSEGGVGARVQVHVVPAMVTLCDASQPHRASAIGTPAPSPRLFH